MKISPEWVSVVASILMAVAAFAVIFTAQMQEWIRHPEFKLKFQPSPPDCNRIPVAYRRLGQPEKAALLVSAEAHYVRVRLENTGKAGAEDLQVVVHNVRRKGPADRRFQSLRMSTPYNLTWKDFPSHVLRGLPRDCQWPIDIGHVVDPQERRQFPGEDRAGSDPSKTLFCLAFFVRSNTLEYLLDPGKYEIDFQVFAANAKPSAVFTFHLNHKGGWYLDEGQMYRDGLEMTVTPKTAT